MIISNYEKLKFQKFKENDIVCETLYYNVNQANSPIYVRSTDGKMLDNINNYAIKEKRYFINNECSFVENEFNPHILYNIRSYNDGDEIIKCTNCGNIGKAKDLIDGCPYCGTDFNFGLNNINISKKEKLAKITNKFFWASYFTIISVLFILITLFFNLNFTNFCYWLSLCIIIFIVEFIFQIIILCIKCSKNPNFMILSSTDLKNVWKITKDEKQFYNDFYKCINNYMYDKKDLIDYDILEINGIEFLTENNVVLDIQIREVYYNGNFSKKKHNLKISMKYIEGKEINGNYSLIKCPNCGASINVAFSFCKYCNTKINYNINWYIDFIKYL